MDFQVSGRQTGVIGKLVRQFCQHVLFVLTLPVCFIDMLSDGFCAGPI